MRRFAALFIAAAAVCVAQQPTELAEVSASAAIVFRGTVLAVVTESPHAPGEIAVARITFRVEDGIRGATTGETITIRQWNVGGEEYRVGETLVMFLHAPSQELGLTSPVGGRAGHRRVDEVPTGLLNNLRTPSKPVTTQTTPANGPGRPTRPSRFGGGTR